MPRRCHAATPLVNCRDLSVPGLLASPAAEAKGSAAGAKSLAVAAVGGAAVISGARAVAGEAATGVSVAVMAAEETAGATAVALAARTHLVNTRCVTGLHSDSGTSWTSMHEDIALKL